MTVTAEWYVPLAGDAPARVFAFPHAGAGCAQFAGLAKAVAPDVALWAANLPGRQARLAEPPPDALEPLVDRLADELADRADRPYALLGYCGGALVAFLVARGLMARGGAAPVALVVVSQEAPDIGHRPRGIATLPGERLWEVLAAGGGMPDLAADERLRRVAEPAVRADFGLLAGYRHVARPPLPYRIVVCHGRADPVRRGALLGWRRQSTRPLELRELSGGHWLLDEAGSELADVVRAVWTGGRA